MQNYDIFIHNLIMIQTSKNYESMNLHLWKKIEGPGSIAQVINLTINRLRKCNQKGLKKKPKQNQTTNQ